MHLSKGKRSWIEVSKNNLDFNLKEIKKLLKSGVKVVGVVKANAYGHGLAEVVGILRDKVDYFGVDNISEALEIRSMGVTTPIIVLGFIPTQDIALAIENDISFVVYDSSVISTVQNLRPAKPAKIHIKIETGLNRQGLKGKYLDNLLKMVKKAGDALTIEGTSMHFSNVEDTLDTSFAREQVSALKNQLKLFKKNKLSPGILHSSATAAAILHPEFNFNMVRIGIGLYGLWPSRETKIATTLKGKKLTLKQVLVWKSVISHIKDVGIGESVSYGRTWYASRPTRIAVVPVGYSDGYDRRLSNIGFMIVNGVHVPVVGRVAMNMVMLDVSDVKKVKVGDEVIVIGNKGATSPDNIAEKLGTINYEIVARLSSLLPREVVLNAKNN